MSNIIRRCALVLTAITCVGFAVAVACGRTSNTAPMQSAPPEVWNGLATHGSTYCNVDAAIVTFWNAYSAWHQLEDDAGKSLPLDDQRDFLGKIGKDGDWCIAFEGLSQHNDKTMETLMFAVGAGVTKERAIQEAELLLARFVRLARGQDAG